MMMPSEMKTRNTMMKAEGTMDDASECVSPAPATLMRQNTREPATRKHLSKAKPFFKIRVRHRPQMAAVDLRQRES